VISMPRFRFFKTQRVRRGFLLAPRVIQNGERKRGSLTLEQRFKLALFGTCIAVAFWAFAVVMLSFGPPS
jgi:hypothetical protein